MTLVSLELPAEPVASSRLVLAAALHLFSPLDPFVLVLTVEGREVPTEADSAGVRDLCAEVAGHGAGMPEVVLLGVSDVLGLPVALHLTPGDYAGDPRAALAELMRLRQVTPGVLMEPAGRLLESAWGAAFAADAKGVRALQEDFRRRGDVARALAVSTGTRKPRVAVLFQRQATWGALVTVWEELATRSEVEGVVVAVDAPEEAWAESGAEFLARRGIRAESPEWLRSHLDDVDVVVRDTPYDCMLPPGLLTYEMASSGVRLVTVPYGCNTAGGAMMESFHWDQPVQRSAWRSYVGSSTQQRLFTEGCLAGGDHVRAVGIPKLDRVVQVSSQEACPRVPLPVRGPVILWNPHFSVRPGGWSTFLTYGQSLLDWFGRHPECQLVVRPHFLLAQTVTAGQGEGAALLAQVRRAAQSRDNVVLDERPDYLESLLAADAMVSDLSSLASEFMLTGRRLLYLEHPSGPGLNEEGRHLQHAQVARSWHDVQEFLDDVARGADPRAEQRRASVSRYFPLADGRAGQRVVDDVVTSLAQELGIGPARDGLPVGEVEPRKAGAGRRPARLQG